MNNVVYEYFHDKSDDLLLSRGINTNCGLHFHRSIEILYLLSGEMRCKVGNKEFTATPDDVIFVHNYYHHSFAPIEDYEKIFLIVPHSYESSFDSALSQDTLPSLMSDKEFNRNHLRPIVETMYDGRKNSSTLVKKGYLNVLIGTLLDHYPSVKLEQNSSMNFLVNVLAYIDENYAKPLTLDTIAHEFGYNKYYFSRLFNTYIGENLNNYINLVRLRNFVSLSKGKDKRSITELAYECGFDSLTTFYRYFNKIYGKSPSEMFNKEK